MTGPEHGGRLNAAARQWDIPVSRWLDLSTGINPIGWPMPELPARVWQRLPEDDDGLGDVIRQWAGAPASAACVPVPGSQAAIKTLPFLRPPGRVGIPEPGYREHGHWWALAGHEVIPLPLEAATEAVAWPDQLDVLVWIHPNNPTGFTLAPDRLRQWHERLAVHGGWLVLDEAFADAETGISLVADTGADRPGLVVLRSLGKFFGLAGLRAGAVLTDPQIGRALSDALGPWALSGPARHGMALALADSDWQRRAARRLARDSARLDKLLSRFGLTVSGGTRLFRYVPHAHTERIADGLARQGVLVRRFDRPPALRFGLPGTPEQWRRLEAALSALESD
ncbi:MAG: threonine-phosphate decarboxylase CobD [Marinobacter sp.]|uniref:threonine-phosphate decarboxylase CobD n=1 Tax=Marinobacter sp. TaxID=50741 RepID=UPI00299E2BFC|nr:threonine-phosphate decarboxylase CobD [Marinobacter sp.]MDX1635575.1 threonine-phosphate decarboxylase CobD [Marinobacter sp.]